MSEELEKLLEAARHRPLSSEEQEEQRRSFAYGNANIENARVTRETVDREAEQLQKQG
jgi:Fic family protein